MNAKLVVIKSFSANGIEYGPTNPEVQLEDVKGWAREALANRLTHGFVQWQPIDPPDVWTPPSADDVAGLTASDESQGEDAGAKKGKKAKGTASDESQG